jgi:hypothetical protein
MWFDQQIKLRCPDRLGATDISVDKEQCQPAELRLGYTLNRDAGEVAASTRRTLSGASDTSSSKDVMRQELII